MRSITAIFVGSAFTLSVIFLLGLIYIFLAVGYNKLAADLPFLNDISSLFRYLIGIPVFIVTMFAGGYITAKIARINTNLKTWLHCLAVGLITVISTMYSALEHSSLTSTGIVVTILALSASSAGGFYWLRDNKTNQSN